MSEFILDEVTEVVATGRDEVFDLQVARTENFIADGFVSHNTRWHMDDIGGRLLDEMASGGDKWHLLNLPAIAGDNDALGRAPGEALWPDWEGTDALTRKRAAVGERAWSALYQQEPTPGEGLLFRIEQIGTVDAAPAGGRIVRAWDLAATAAGDGRDPDWTVGVKLQRVDDRYVVLDVTRLRGGPEQVMAAVLNTAAQDGRGVAISLPQDPGQAGKSQAQYFVQRLAGFSVTSSPETGDKSTRAAPVASQANVGNVSFVRAPWNRGLLEEMRDFPAGRHDDQVDALSRAFSSLTAGGTVQVRRMGY
jgi:predicted phage terminase large subunit-like protein